MPASPLIWFGTSGVAAIAVLLAKRQAKVAKEAMCFLCIFIGHPQSIEFEYKIDFYLLIQYSTYYYISFFVNLQHAFLNKLSPFTYILLTNLVSLVYSILPNTASQKYHNKKRTALVTVPLVNYFFGKDSSSTVKMMHAMPT